MSETTRLHGTDGERGARRWCAGCEAWVPLIEWTDHHDHGDDIPCYLCNTETPEEDLLKRPYGPEQRVNVYLCEDCAERGGC